MLRLKFEYSDKYLQNLNLTRISPVPIFTYPCSNNFFFFFEPLSSQTRLATKFFNFENFDAFFSLSNPFQAFVQRGNRRFLCAICKRSRRADYSDPNKSSSSFFFPCSHRTSGSPSLFHRPFLFPPAKDLTVELQHGH